LVFSEKPLSLQISEAKEINDIYLAKKIPVLVNYSRRFVPEFNKLQQNIKSGLYGKFVTGTGYYGKGILHNGSHMIDLLRFLIDEIKSVKRINSESDYDAMDLSVSGVLTFYNGKQFYLQNVDHRLYTIFEIDLLFEKRRIRIIDSGFIIEDYIIEKNKIFHAYKTISSKKIIHTHLGISMFYAADNIRNYLEGKKTLLSPISEAYKTMIVCSKFLKHI